MILNEPLGCQIKVTSCSPHMFKRYVSTTMAKMDSWDLVLMGVVSARRESGRGVRQNNL